MISTLLALFLIGIAGLVVLSILGAILGMAFSLIGLLLFKVLPIMIVGYIVLRIIAPKKEASAADTEWLNT